MMENLSYWEKQTYLGKPDVAIIGGGITGLTTAIFYKKQNPQQDVLVLERGALPSGASTKNAGFACFGSVSELLDDSEQLGWEPTIDLVERRWRGLQLLRELIPDPHLQLQFSGGYELFTQNNTELWERCKSAVPVVNEQLQSVFGRNVFTLSTRNWDFGEYLGLIENPLEGGLNPVAMIRQLEKLARNLGVRILTGAAVERIEEGPIRVKLTFAGGAHLDCPQAAVCTNGFAARLLNVEVRPARNQVLVTEPITNLPFDGVFHYDQGYFYFRNVGKRVLIGGGRHLAGEEEDTDQLSVTDGIQVKLEDLLKTNVIPGREYRVAHRWSGILGVGDSREPIVKRISPSISCAVRLGGMGVALGTLLGQELAELLEKID